MATFSTGLRDAVASGLSWLEALSGGRIYIYSGTKPTSADDTPVGTLLGIFTLNGGAYTAPVRSTADIQITGGGGGSVDTVKVGGMDLNLIGSAVAWDTNADTTAAAVAAAINTTSNPLGIVATVSTDTVTLYLPYWLGANGDSLTLATTTTTVTHSTDATFSGGTTCVNGLDLDHPASAGVISKPSGTVWEATALADGTAAWFRWVAGGSSYTGSSTSDIRFDGEIGTSGAELNVPSTSLVNTTTQSCATFSVNITGV